MACAQISHTTSRHALAEDEMVLSDALSLSCPEAAGNGFALELLEELPLPRLICQALVTLFPLLIDSSLKDRIQEEIKTVVNEVIAPVDVKQEAFFDSLSSDGERAADGGG